jgi:hypothetical protein
MTEEKEDFFDNAISDLQKLFYDERDDFWKEKFIFMETFWKEEMAKVLQEKEEAQREKEMALREKEAWEQEKATLLSDLFKYTGGNGKKYETI